MAKKTERSARDTSESLEVCAGCEAEAAQHPIIGIMNKADAQDIQPVVTSADNPDWVGVPVCKDCHENPAHRKFQLKCHFHPRATAKMGVVMAGSADVGM